MSKRKSLIDELKAFFIASWKKALIVFFALNAVLTFVTIFFKINFSALDFALAITFIAVSSAVLARNEAATKGTRYIDISERIGSSRSINDVYPDKCHKFTHITRQDLLDYRVSKQSNGQTTNGRHFVSIRFLEGYNASKHTTDGIIYLECSEYRAHYHQIKVVAHDMKTSRELKVEFCGLEINKKYTDFPFKIFFQKPLNPGEEFKIIFSITLINELEVLTDNDEIMSICLLRYKKGVEKLDFNVCLDFEPQTVNVLSQKKLGGKTFDFAEDDFIIEKYIPTGEWEKRFDINWSSQPYIIRWGCDKPRRKFYVINYRR